MLEIPIGNKLYPSWVVEGVDTLLSKIDSQPIWVTVDFIIQLWARKNPAEAKAFFSAQEAFKQSRKRKTGASKDESFRNLVHIPPEVKLLLDKLLVYQIQEMGELTFYRQFAKRYPGFSSVEKI
jgi:hypothetical protein